MGDEQENVVQVENESAVNAINAMNSLPVNIKFAVMELVFAGVMRTLARDERKVIFTGFQKQVKAILSGLDVENKK